MRYGPVWQVVMRYRFKPQQLWHRKLQLSIRLWVINRSPVTTPARRPITTPFNTNLNHNHKHSQNLNHTHNSQESITAYNLKRYTRTSRNCTKGTLFHHLPCPELGRGRDQPLCHRSQHRCRIALRARGRPWEFWASWPDWGGGAMRRAPGYGKYYQSHCSIFINIEVFLMLNIMVTCSVRDYHSLWTSSRWIVWGWH